MQRNISKKGIVIRFIVALIILEFALFHNFQSAFFKQILFLIASYYFICAIIKTSPIFKLLNINTYNKKIETINRIYALKK